MIVYGLTKDNGLRQVFPSKSARSLVVRTTSGAITEWEYDVPDEVTTGGTPLPTTYGAMITAKLNGIDTPITLTRMGQTKYFPWMGYDVEAGRADCWADSRIVSWEPYRVVPSAEALSEYLFQVQGWVLEEQEARDLEAFIADEMIR
jgi:hypothetical protein